MRADHVENLALDKKVVIGAELSRQSPGESAKRMVGTRSDKN